MSLKTFTIEAQSQYFSPLWHGTVGAARGETGRPQRSSALSMSRKQTEKCRGQRVRKVCGKVRDFEVKFLGLDGLLVIRIEKRRLEQIL